MLITQVELPVSDAVQAARFYGHRRAAKRREGAGADRELPSQGGLTGSPACPVAPSSVGGRGALLVLANGACQRVAPRRRLYHCA